MEISGYNGTRIDLRTEERDGIEQFFLTYHLRFDAETRMIGIVSLNEDKIIFPKKEGVFLSMITTGTQLNINDLLMGCIAPQEVMFLFLEKTNFSCRKVLTSLLDKRVFVSLEGHSLVAHKFPKITFRVDGELVELLDKGGGNE